MDAVSSVSPHPAEMMRGKSAMAPGQLAKVAVTEARAAGIEVPKNAQGFAASQIAKGADPASIFAAVVAPVDEIDPVDPADPDVAPTEEGDADAAVADEDPAGTTEVGLAYDSAAEILAAEARTSAEVALDLLS